MNEQPQLIQGEQIKLSPVTGFWRRMVSDNGEPSSKRVLAVETMQVLLLVFVAVVVWNVDLKPAHVHLFEILLGFALLCLGLNVASEIWGKKKDEPA